MWMQSTFQPLCLCLESISASLPQRRSSWAASPVPSALAWTLSLFFVTASASKCLRSRCHGLRAWWHVHQVPSSAATYCLASAKSPSVLRLAVFLCQLREPDRFLKSLPFSSNILLFIPMVTHGLSCPVMFTQLFLPFPVSSHALAHSVSTRYDVRSWCWYYALTQEQGTTGRNFRPRGKYRFTLWWSLLVSSSNI